MKSKIGKFYIDRETIMNNQPLAAEIFRQLSFIPIRTELLAYLDKFEYYGFSPVFDEVENDIMAPDYEVVIEMVEYIEKGGKYPKISVKRI